MKTRQAFPAPAGAAAGTPGERGFSMIEALIAAALIGVIAIGIIPMFTRAMSDNMAGSDYTRVTNYAKSSEEDFIRQPFSNEATQVITGATSTQKLEYFNPATQQWVVGAVPTGNTTVVWTRITTFTLFSAAVDNTNLLFDQPVTGGSLPQSIQMVQAQVQVKAVSPLGPEGAHRSTTIRMLKAF